MEEQVERRTITMYPRQWQIAEEYAGREGLNLSLAIRKIITEWDGLQEISMTTPPITPDRPAG